MPDPERSSKGIGDPGIRTVVLGSHQSTDSTVFRQYSVVGTYADGGPRDFVQHVALLRDQCRLDAPGDVEVYHMGPPIVAGEQTAATAPSRGRACKAHILGDIALNAEEREAIEDWLAEVEKEDRTDVKPFQQYVVIPHVKWITAPETGRRIRRRFSCAGFVIECYRAAEIDLIDTEAEMPKVDQQLLVAAYPHFAQIEANDRLKERLGFRNRADLGLHGDGPWRILLAGYVFHSLKRATTDDPRPSPHLPRSTSEGSFSG